MPLPAQSLALRTSVLHYFKLGPSSSLSSLGSVTQGCGTLSIDFISPRVCCVLLRVRELQPGVSPPQHIAQGSPSSTLLLTGGEQREIVPACT